MTVQVAGKSRVDGTPFLSPLLHTYKVLIGKGLQKNKKKFKTN